MDKNAQTYYAIVSVEEGLLPRDSKEYVSIIRKAGKDEIIVRINAEVMASMMKINGTSIEYLSEQQGVILSVEEWEKVKVKDDIIRSLEQQIQQANEKLDQIGAPSISAYGNQLTIFGRLDGCVYVESKPQLNTKP